MSQRKKKNILFIAPKYFTYDKIIFEYLTKKGYSVDLVHDRPFNSNFFKVIIRINRSWIGIFLFFFYIKAFSRLPKKKYSLIFVIQGEGLTPRILKWLRIRNPKTPFVYYLWDSIKNKPMLKENLAHFDSIFTFDKVDAKNFNMFFAPLFSAMPKLQVKDKKYIYDLSFIGTIHQDRMAILKDLAMQLPNKKIFFYLYSPSLILFLIQRFFFKQFRALNIKSVNFNQLPYYRVQEILMDSNVILDIHHSGQTGLTIRTIESLTLGKKLITTNKSIKTYDFYNPLNILVVDRKKVHIPEAFFKSKYVPIPQVILNKYTLEGFYKRVISPFLGN